MKIAVFVVLLILASVTSVWWFNRPSPIEVIPSTDYLLYWPEGPTIQTRMGAVTGLSNGDSLAFLGLPYARPPIAERRFRKSEPAVPWSGVADATAFPNICIQDDPPALLGDVNRFVRTEDCLYLNVFTPSIEGKVRPVLVWIHGGSFTGGSANDYDGSILAEQGDVVVVAINYRLGMLGFLDLSGYGEEFDGSGSNGISDQIEALRWVRDNIDSFGGDKGNVTIFGESAGGQSVMAIMASPSADGLYHKAISHSGGTVNAPAVDARGLLANHVGVVEEKLLETLQTLAPDAVLAAQNTISWGGGGRIDGTVVTRSIKEAIIDRGRYGVPMIAGSNLDEGTLFSYLIPQVFYGIIGEAVADNIVENMDGKQYVEELKAAYPTDDRTRIFERVWTDLLVRGGANAAARASAAGPGGWLYRFDLPVQRLPGVGATHGAEIAFTFNQFARELPGTAFWYDRNDGAVRQLANAWSNTVIQFAKTGDPNGAGLPAWPRYTAESRQTLILDGNPRVMSNVHAVDRTRWGDTESSSSEYLTSTGR